MQLANVETEKIAVSPFTRKQLTREQKLEATDFQQVHVSSSLKEVFFRGLEDHSLTIADNQTEWNSGSRR